MGVPVLLDGDSGAVKKFPSFNAGDCERSDRMLGLLRLGLPTDEVEPTEPRRDISAVDDDKLAAHFIV